MDMRTAAEWLNPVKAGGLAAYLVAFVSCALTAVRTANRRLSRLAALLGLIHALLLLDIAFDWRWGLYDWLRREALSWHWYEERHGPQVVTLAILAFVLVSGVIAARSRLRSLPGAGVAAEGTVLSVACWIMEIISLHATDSVLYHRIGPLMVISFVWLLACAMVTAGILMAASRAPVDLLESA
jgi:hypothetical protein